METLLLKGKAVSDATCSGLQLRIKPLIEDGIVPKLAAILVGDDPASQVYVRNKARAFEKLNCKSQTFKLKADSGEADVLELIIGLNIIISIKFFWITKIFYPSKISKTPSPTKLHRERWIHSSIIWLIV